VQHDVPARHLEGQSVAVEWVGETEVVKQRRDVVQLVVERDAVRAKSFVDPTSFGDANDRLAVTPAARVERCGSVFECVRRSDDCA